MKPNLVKNSPCLVATLFLAVSAGLTNGADYPTTVQSFNPLGYWRLSETVTLPAPNTAANLGSLGAAGTGHILSAVTNGQPGKVGTSFRFSNPDFTGANAGYLPEPVVDVPYHP